MSSEMAQIHKRTLEEALASLPDILELDLNGFAQRQDSAFVCALGFEERCLSIPRALAQVGYSARDVYCLVYSTSQEHNDLNRAELEVALGQIASGSVTLIQVDEVDSSRLVAEALASSCSNSQEPDGPSIAFDVSVVANRVLLRTMKSIFLLECRLTVLYSEAAVYGPTFAEYNADKEKWSEESSLGLERGVSAVSFSKEYPGEQLEPLPNSVILFPGFRPERSKAVIDAVDPALLTNPGANVVWLIGTPHLPEDAWRSDVMRDINNIEESFKTYDISTFDYKHTLTTLDKLYWERVAQRNITLSPIGSKMQALGCALFLYLHPDVRVAFATPREYNADQYSHGCKAMWVVEFTKLSESREMLDRVGQLVLTD